MALSKRRYAHLLNVLVVGAAAAEPVVPLATRLARPHTIIGIDEKIVGIWFDDNPSPARVLTIL